MHREELFGETRQETTTIQPTYRHRVGTEPRLHWWEASIHATTSSLLAKKSLEKFSSSADMQVTHCTCCMYIVEKEFIHELGYKPFLSFLYFPLEMRAWEVLNHFQALQLVMQKTPH